MSVRDLKLYRPYLHINQKRVPILLKIQNKDTETYFNQEEMNSNKETKLPTIHQTIEIIQERAVALNKWLA